MLFLPLFFQHSFFCRLTEDKKSEKFFRVFYDRMKLAQLEIKATVTVNTSDLGNRKRDDESQDKDPPVRKKGQRSPETPRPPEVSFATAFSLLLRVCAQPGTPAWSWRKMCGSSFWRPRPPPRRPSTPTGERPTPRSTSTQRTASRAPGTRTRTTARWASSLSSCSRSFGSYSSSVRTTTGICRYKRHNDLLAPKLQVQSAPQQQNWKRKDKSSRSHTLPPRLYL